MLNKGNGITLVALVITIVVLVVLAGVGINLSMGENGILGKAKNAVDVYKEASKNEQIELAKLENLIYGNRNIDKTELINLLKEIIEEEHIDTNPTGTIISYMGNNVPNGGYLKCDGTVYNISDYPKLATQIETEFGSKNHFGGDGETTFAVPDLIGRFLKGSTTAGAKESAGLPNITGRFGGYTLPNSNELTVYADSALYRYASGGQHGHTSQNTYDRWSLGFDASRSNAIYGHSTTVTPENISVLYCIKY